MRDKHYLFSTRGMTLLEIMIVIILIALIMTVVGKGLIGQGDAAKGRLNAAKMEKLKQVIEGYKLQYNRYPTNLEDLIKKSSDLGSAYFTSMADKDDFEDLWGGQYLYQTENNQRSFTLKSLGKDGIEGGEGPNQDITLKPGSGS